MTHTMTYSMISTRYFVKWYEDGKEQSTWFLDLEDAKRSRARLVHKGHIVKLIKRTEQSLFED